MTYDKQTVHRLFNYQIGLNDMLLIVSNKQLVSKAYIWMQYIDNFDSGWFYNTW